MKTGTKSILFGVHQVAIHPLFVFAAWLILYRSLPKLHQFAAILTHDWGYWGSPDMDGSIGERHPERIANWWHKFGHFGDQVAREILGHSRFYAQKEGIGLSMLFYPDKLSTALYPKWLYLALGNLSGEIQEYMARCEDRYKDEMSVPTSQLVWLTEVQAFCAKLGFRGVKK